MEISVLQCYLYILFNAWEHHIFYCLNVYVDALEGLLLMCKSNQFYLLSCPFLYPNLNVLLALYVVD